jgi:hypothetical protein
MDVSDHQMLQVSTFEESKKKSYKKKKADKLGLGRDYMA